MKKNLTILLSIAVFLITACGNGQSWTRTSDDTEDPNPDAIFYSGKAVLSGWGIEVPYYKGDPELHFHVATESIKALPQDINFKKWDWNFKLENSDKDFNEILAKSTQLSKIEIIVDEVKIVQEGHPVLHLVRYEE